MALTYSLFCNFSFGGAVDSYPHPELDFGGFMRALERQNALASKVWDPVSGRMQPWIKKHRLHAMAPGACCTIS